MIIPPTKSFFVIHIHGEAADLISEPFSPSTTSDIRESVLMSDDYESDIQAHNDLDKALAKFQKDLGDNLISVTKYNPLYIPSSEDQINEVLEGNESGEAFRFIGMDGNPFTMKSVTVSRDDEVLIEARVACQQFELPALSEIMAGQANLRMH